MWLSDVTVSVSTPRARRSSPLASAPAAISLATRMRGSPRDIASSTDWVFVITAYARGSCPFSRIRLRRGQLRVRVCFPVFPDFEGLGGIAASRTRGTIVVQDRGDGDTSIHFVGDDPPPALSETPSCLTYARNRSHVRHR